MNADSTIAVIQTPNALPTINRDGVLLTDATDLKWGDTLSNTSATPMEIKIPARAPGQGDTLLVLQPGANARLEQISSDVADGASRTKVVALSEGVELYDIDDQIASAVLEQGEGEEAMAGLLGAGLLAGGLGGGALAAGAVAAGAFLASDDDDENGAGAGSSGGGAGGLAGGLESLGDGVEQTPLAPVAGATDALAGGLGTVGGAIAGVSDQDPTGLTDVLSNVVGDPASGDGSSAGGLVGVVNAVSTGLATGTQDTPLAPLVDPLTQTLGSDGGAVDGVAQGLADAGNLLTQDGSPLAPLTGGVLGPVVGTNPDGTDTNGVPGLLNEAGEGLTDLTNPDSALAPLDALTEPLDTQVVDTLAGGVDMLGDAITDASSQDPTGTLELVGELLGGDTASGSASGGAGLPIDGLPLDMLTSALPISGDAGGSPLDALTGALPI